MFVKFFKHSFVWQGWTRISIFWVLYYYYFFRTDDYTNILVNGVLGYTAAYVKYVNTEFQFELENL